MIRTFFLTVFVSTISVLASGLINLNNPSLTYHRKTPPIPHQTQNYINIATYNIRASQKDLSTLNSWDRRKGFYSSTIRSDDEAWSVMSSMQANLRAAMPNYFTIQGNPKNFSTDARHCTTCSYSADEPFPIGETKFFRIALKTGNDSKGVLYGNFPYPYRLIIALKRHASHPSPEEWTELGKVLQDLATKVAPKIGAIYTSYASFQDLYYKAKAAGEPIEEQPHFFMHFIFRFPEGESIAGIDFRDPNPYDQFSLAELNLVKEGSQKPNSAHIYKRVPDIVNIQEICPEQIPFLRKQLPNHTLVGYSAHSGKSIDLYEEGERFVEMLGIAYRKDLFDCIQSGIRWLSATPEIPSIAPGADRERICVWMELLDKRTGKTFFMFNVHYDHQIHDTSFIDAEKKIIESVAGDAIWFSVGERFYKHHQGENLYQYYLNHNGAQDVRYISLLGHYGEAGTWGGFENDPFAVGRKNGEFACDTLDLAFTNKKNCEILFSYSIPGAYSSETDHLYRIYEPVPADARLASDHFMSGFYVILSDNE